MTSQTLVTGKTALASKYPMLGYSGVNMRPVLTKCFGMLVGIAGAGKSTILQSNPEAYILNLDLSPTVVNPIKATIWPGLANDGRTTDVGGAIIQLSWEKVREKIDLLIRMAANGDPRPECVCFDSLHGMIRLLKDFLIRKGRKNGWKELDGRAAWDDLHEIVCALPYELRAAGYGVWYTCHLGKKYVQLSQEITEVVPELTITDNFFKKLHPIFDIVAPVKKKIEITVTREDVELKNESGAVVGKMPRDVTRERAVHLIDFDDQALQGISKGRNMKGQILFTANDGWQKFEEVYRSLNEDAYTS